MRSVASSIHVKKAQPLHVGCTGLPCPASYQVCTDRAYSDNTTSCTKKCAVVTPAPAAPAEPVPGNDMPVTTVVGSGKAMYGGKNVAANTRPMVGRKLLGGASLLGTMGRKLKGGKSTKGGGVAYTYVAAQPQVVYAQPQYFVVQQQQPQYTYVAAAQPQYTYVAAPAPQGELVCNDVSAGPPLGWCVLVDSGGAGSDKLGHP